MCNVNINNQIYLRGFLTKQVSLSYYNNSKNEKCAIGRFTLAVKNSNDKDSVDFIPITIFSGAEALSKYTVKGSQLMVSATIRNNSYKKKIKGKEDTVYQLELIASGFEFLGNPKSSYFEDEKYSQERN